MAARSSWEGFLRLSLISVPVKAYTTAAREGQHIHFHEIHAGCGSRIRHQKICPIHGEVNKDEVVSGYEISKDNYVVVEPDELAKLRPDDEKTIAIDAFVDSDSIEPIYFSGRSYYLTPDGKTAQQSYGIIRRVMADQKRSAVAQVVLSGRQQLALIWPIRNLLAMTLLNYEDQVKKPSAFEGDVINPKLSRQEVELAKSLVDTSTAGDFKLSHYHDEYETELRELIEAKSKGKKIAPRHAAKEPAVVNLMDALRKSLGQAHKKKKSHPNQRNARRKTA